jgi:hypothetical protein
MIMAVFELVDYAVAIWIFAAAYALHEVEEWNSLGWHRRNFLDMPADETDTSLRTFLVLASITGFIWAAVATVWGNPSVAAFLFLPAVAVALQNALQHLYWQFSFREYAPGIVTSALLLIPGAIYLAVVAVGQGFVPLWYVVGLALLVVPGLILTVKAGHRLTQQFHAILRFSIALSRWLGRSQHEVL